MREEDEDKYASYTPYLRGFAMLRDAAASGRESEVMTLLSDARDVNASNCPSLNPLIAACREDEPGSVRACLAALANPNVQTADGVTPLIMSCHLGNDECAKALLSHGLTNRRTKSQTGLSALAAARANGHEACIEVLLAEEVCCASAQGNLEGLRRLLTDHPERASSVDARGRPALLCACFHGQHACARLLLDQGADVNALSETGATPLIVASYYGHQPCVELLLANGADASVRSKAYGGTALHVAREQERDTIARLLPPAQRGEPSDFIDERSEEREMLEGLCAAGLAGGMPMMYWRRRRKKSRAV